MVDLLRNALARFSVAALATKFVLDRTGRDLGIGRSDKLRLAAQLVRNAGRISSLTTLQRQFVLVREIVAVPSSIKGDVVECGCYEGGSTAALSLACALTHRRLFVCDTFAGLPKPRDDEAFSVHPHSGTFYQWEEGDFSSRGGLEGVRENIRRYGNLDYCRFVVGLFTDTLADLDTNDIVLVFEDADLRSSVEDCLKHLWPKLKSGCKFFCDEPWSIAVVSLFYDRAWWREHLNSDPPGFYGSGGGVDYALSSSNMGFAIKFDAEQVKQTGRRILHRGSKSLRAG